MKFRSLTVLLIPLAAVALAGCKGEDHENTGDSGSTVERGDHEDHAHGHGEAHAHPSEGPHGGTLVELGAEEYHAELVHDDQSGTVGFYILDGKAESPVAIDASEVAVNLQHDGQGKQFKLAAKPQSQDAQGKSSRFVSSDAGLAQELDHGHGSAQLVATIDGKQYRGDIESHHGHEVHDHGRNGHENHGHEGHRDE